MVGANEPTPSVSKKIGDCAERDGFEPRCCAAGRSGAGKHQRVADCREYERE
jgi:hypothetical protein